jgi:alkanesulfonate monooxygenase SsuD/methylene tetrahydromethanopterin reductase-like flavin-dependent oxidoreductase (luciferase family)
MEVGILHGIQNYQDKYDDAEVMRRSLALADIYEPAGLDFCLVAEHHFTSYTMTPVPFDFLSYMAGRTKRIKLGPGVIIVPWNDPYRAAAHLISLDHLSNGRAIIGFGRGLSKVEMDHFGIDMSDTRAMFDEGARKILEAVTTGSFPGGGKFYSQQTRSPMRPRPLNPDWKNRTFCVGMSPASVVEAGRLGGRLMSFAQGPWENYKESHLAPYLAAFRENHSGEPGPLVLAENVIVHEDRERAYEIATEYFGNYHRSVQEFYQLGGAHFQGLKGYESYAEAAKLAEDDQRTAYINISLHGTPADVLEKLRERRRVLDHPFDLCALVDIGDIPFSVAQDCIRLIGETIVPVVRDWDPEFRSSAALAAAAE